MKEMIEKIIIKIARGYGFEKIRLNPKKDGDVYVRVLGAEPNTVAVYHGDPSTLIVGQGYINRYENMYTKNPKLVENIIKAHVLHEYLHIKSHSRIEDAVELSAIAGLEDPLEYILLNTIDVYDYLYSQHTVEREKILERGSDFPGRISKWFDSCYPWLRIYLKKKIIDKARSIYFSEELQDAIFKSKNQNYFG